MKSIAAVAALSALASGAALSRRQTSFHFECSGSQVPDYSACESIMGGICGNPTGTIGPLTPPANEWVFAADDTQNCQISVLINDSGFVVTNEQVCQGYAAVRDSCAISGNGGSAVEYDGKFNVNVLNNPEYRAPSKMKRQQDGDTSFSYGIHTVDDRPSQYRSTVGDGYPGQTSITISESESVTNSVSFSSSVSADFFEIISASVGFDVSQSETTESSTGVTIPLNCPDNQVAQLYFQPYFESWYGAFSPSGSTLTIYRPETNSDGSTKGEYNYECHD